jgi:hypothetical protein
MAEGGCSGGRGQRRRLSARKREGGGRGAPWRPAAAKRAEALALTLSLASWGRLASFRGRELAAHQEGGGGRRERRVRSAARAVEWGSDSGWVRRRERRSGAARVPGERHGGRRGRRKRHGGRVAR